MTGEAQQKCPLLKAYIQRDDVMFDKQVRELELQAALINTWIEKLRNGSCSKELVAEAVRVDIAAMRHIIGEYA